MHGAVSSQIPVYKSETKSWSLSLSSSGEKEDKAAEYLCSSLETRGSSQTRSESHGMNVQKGRPDDSSRNGCYDLHSA